ncbi:MAG: glycoside hydrolase family 43 protein [Chitinispirillaceae bacterium]|nr:glycoside hydrolase family 43 protein [Chitinispirillaceae bacterium]
MTSIRVELSGKAALKKAAGCRKKTALFAGCCLGLAAVATLFEQCLLPFEPPPPVPLSDVLDTTLHDTVVVGGTVFNNPIIPGFHPDPSICRVGSDYYLVTSSFEYFPGVPVFHSRDLVNWRQIGHCLTRKNQLDQTGVPSSGGAAAATIRYHEGLFYVILTANGKNFFVTATDPAGEWSDPVYTVFDGFDPSLFFDDDGRAFLQSQEGRDSGSHIIQYEIDPATGQVLSPKKTIWTGDGDVWLEGPHLYKINNVYYLTAASGGTGWNHHQVLAASARVFGPYEPCPYNPVLSHKDTREPIQFTGHADFFQDENGKWWSVFLAVRHMDKGYSPLGRETFLSPVLWKKGWPVIGDNGRVSLAMKGPLPPLQSLETIPNRDDFTQAELPLCYVFVRNPMPGCYSLRGRPGWLSLRGNEATLSTRDLPAFVGRRQGHFSAVVTVKMEFNPVASGEEAGVAVRLNEKAHYEMGLVKRGEINRCMVRSCTWGESRFVDSIDVTSSVLFLRVACSHERYAFSCAQQDTLSFQHLADLESKPLTMEHIFAFTGVVIGMYATGNGKSCEVPACFDWFEYAPARDSPPTARLLLQ